MEISHGRQRRPAPACLRRRPAWCALLWLALCLPAAAQDLGVQSAHWKVNRVESATRFAADASSVADYMLEREALSEQGAQTVGKASRAYNRALQRHEVVEAYTLKVDGRKLPVAADAIQVQSGVAASGANPSMPEMAIVLVTFPDVQRGDRTVLRGRLITHTPMLPGWAQSVDLIVPVVAFDQVAIRIEAPKALGLKVFSDGFTLQQEDGGDSAVWQLRASSPARVPDPSPANSLTGLPRFYASVWNDHAQLARAYAEQANARRWSPTKCGSSRWRSRAARPPRAKKRPRSTTGCAGTSATSPSISGSAASCRTTSPGSWEIATATARTRPS